MNCMQCGMANDGTAKFCTACGASLRCVPERAVEKQRSVNAPIRIIQPLVTEKTSDFAEGSAEGVNVAPKRQLTPAPVMEDSVTAYHRHERARKNRTITVVALFGAVVLICLLWFFSYKKNVTEKAVAIAQTGDYVLAYAELKKVYKGTDSLTGACIAFQGTLQNYILNGSTLRFYYFPREELRTLWKDVQARLPSNMRKLSKKESYLYQLAENNNRILEEETKTFIDSLFLYIDMLLEACNYYSLYLSGKNTEPFFVKDVRAHFDLYAIVNERAASHLEELTGQIPVVNLLENEDGTLAMDENNNLVDLNLPVGETRISSYCVRIIEKERKCREDFLMELAQYSDDDKISYKPGSIKQVITEFLEDIENTDYNNNDEYQSRQREINELENNIAPSFLQKRCIFMK